MQSNTKKIVTVSVIAAMYVVLSLITFPIASGIIQFRLSEGLCLFPLILPETCISLCMGCFLTNLITGCAVFDTVFGSIISLIAGLLTALMGKIIKNTPLKLILGGIFPVLLNAFCLPLIWYYCYGQSETIYILQVIFLIASESLSVYLVGVLVYISMKKLRKC